MFSKLCAVALLLCLSGCGVVREINDLGKVMLAGYARAVLKKKTAELEGRGGGEEIAEEGELDDAEGFTDEEAEDPGSIPDGGEEVVEEEAVEETSEPETEGGPCKAPGGQHLVPTRRHSKGTLRFQLRSRRR